MLKLSDYSEIDIKECRLIKKGKVRDIYQIEDKLLLVATDRISAFDYILPNLIPQKGIVLTKISSFWFNMFKDTVNNHIIETNLEKFPAPLQPYKNMLWGRSVLVKKSEVIPIECVVRGYLAGSGYKEYIKSNSVCAINLPAGLQKGSKLPEPIFTPSTKADEGHDENINEQQAIELIGKDKFEVLKNTSIMIYKKAQEYAAEKGIILADTKFEFGVYNNEIILIDEILTPDSSRFWPMDKYSVGQNPKSFDKQFVRDYLESINWDKQPPVPKLPQNIISKTREKYIEAYIRLTGKNDLAFI